MNTSTSNTWFENFNIPSRAETACLKPVNINDDLDEDIHFFHVFKPINGLPGPTPVPGRRHAVPNPDRMVVSASMMRKIEHELMNDDCDPRTVFNSCRGLAKGTLEFEDAYIAARIRSFAKHQRIVNDPVLYAEANAEDRLMNAYRMNVTKQLLPPPPHPMAVNHLGHLMRHFGIWVVGLLGIQFFASWRIGAFASAHLDGGRYFYFAIAVFLFLALDSAIWFRRRGNHCNVFLVPGIALFLMALLPVFILHVRAILLAG